MIIPIVFEKREVTVDELRALQMRNLTATLTESDKWLLDALLSWLAMSWANVQALARGGAERNGSVKAEPLALARLMPAKRLA